METLRELNIFDTYICDTIENIMFSKIKEKFEKVLIELSERRLRMYHVEKVNEGYRSRAVEVKPHSYLIAHANFNSMLTDIQEHDGCIVYNDSDIPRIIEIPKDYYIKSINKKV